MCLPRQALGPAPDYAHDCLCVCVCVCVCVRGCVVVCVCVGVWACVDSAALLSTGCYPQSVLTYRGDKFQSFGHLQAQGHPSLLPWPPSILCVGVCEIGRAHV